MNNMDITEQILRLNYAGLPIEWINYQTAVRLYCSDQVTYECGESSLIVRGGVNRITGQQSKVEINSIIATKNYSKASYKEIVELNKAITYVSNLIGAKDKGYRALTNIGSDGGQEVPHLHFHIFAGEKIGKMVS